MRYIEVREPSVFYIDLNLYGDNTSFKKYFEEKRNADKVSDMPNRRRFKRNKRLSGKKKK